MLENTLANGTRLGWEFVNVAPKSGDPFALYNDDWSPKPLMKVVDGNNYILVASQGGAPEHPKWYYNLRADPDVEIRDKTEVHAMRVREVVDPVERERLWKIAVQAFPNYAEYQKKTDRLIPVFLAEPRN